MIQYILCFGSVAQLGERCLRMAEVESSNLFGSRLGKHRQVSVLFSFLKIKTAQKSLQAGQLKGKRRMLVHQANEDALIDSLDCDKQCIINVYVWQCLFTAVWI